MADWDDEKADDIMKDLRGIFAGRHLHSVHTRIAIGLREAHAQGVREGLERAARESEMCGRILKTVHSVCAQAIANNIRALFRGGK